jgi:predicted PurR-regulated permease PerM
MPQYKSFLVLIALVSLGFAWVLWPLFGAVFWAVTTAIVFDPMARRMVERLGGRRNLAAGTMILGIVLIIIIPLLLILAAVVREATGLIAAVRSGEIDLHLMFAQMLETLPSGVKALLTRFGLNDLAGVQDSLSASISDWVGANAPVMLSFGQNTVGVFVGLCIMLYLTFFLFRDGEVLLAHIKSAIPMERGVLEDLLGTFTLVVRATVRGDLLVALLQGSLGGLGFWVLGVHAAILWTVLMSFLSLFPVFGAALVWFPVALYFLSQGMIWQGIGLILYGALVISLVDNIVRPWLVGQATRMPDYVVLISTIGGIATFGMQGFITGPVVAAMFIAVWKTFLALPKG